MKRTQWMIRDGLVLIAATFSLGFTDVNVALGEMLAVANPSFETPDFGATDDLSRDPPPDWSSGGTTNYRRGESDSFGVRNPSEREYKDAQDNDNELPGDGDGYQYAYITQTKPDSGSITAYLKTTEKIGTVQANTTYTLNVAVGNRFGDTDTGGVKRPGTVGIALLGGSVSAASASRTASQLAEGTFTKVTTSFTTGASDDLIGTDLRVKLSQTVTSGGLRANGKYDSDRQANFDNVRVEYQTEEVPEPAALGLVGLGCLILGGCRRRRCR